MYDVDPADVVVKSRLKPGRMLLVDTTEKMVIQDVELKKKIAQSRPHGEWLKEKVCGISIFSYNINEIHKMIQVKILPSKDVDFKLKLFGTNVGYQCFLLWLRYL